MSYIRLKLIRNFYCRKYNSFCYCRFIAIEPLLGEEVSGFKKFDKTLRLKQIDISPVSYETKEEHKPVSTICISIVMVKNYDGEFCLRIDNSKNGGEDKLSIFAHRDDDDYFRADPIREILTSEYLKEEDEKI
jgi:hypothetical protein